MLVGGLPALTIFLSASRFTENKTAPAFYSVDSTALLDLISDRPVRQNAIGVGFIGDSHTIHDEMPQVWNHLGEVEATSLRNDFVPLNHRLYAIGTKHPSDPPL